jgi:sodium/potassium-transporting ATPase subunit alpha
MSEINTEIYPSLPLKNQMTVSDCLVSSESLTAAAAAGAHHLSKGKEDHKRVSKALEILAELGGICNAGEFDAATNTLPPEQRRVLGDATDSAILRFSESLVSVAQTRAKLQRIYRVAFNSRNKFMIQVTQPGYRSSLEKDDSVSTLMIKGAPDILLPRCLFYLDGDGNREPLSEDHRRYVESLKDGWSSQGKRVILMARKFLSPSDVSASVDSKEYEDTIMEEAKRGLELVGLVGIVDPPKDEIPEVVSILRGAGIKVHMVTGDFQLTAVAIARECGIISVRNEAIEDASALSVIEVSDAIHIGCRALAISGAELKGLDQHQWDKLCSYDEIVFARTTPEQKLRIVKELQARGEIVGSKFCSYRYSLCRPANLTI